MEEQNQQNVLLENIASSLGEIIRILRFVSKSSIKDILESTLNTNEKRKVYNLLDGDKTIANIEELTKVNHRFISEWGQEWEKLGIVETDQNALVKGRRRKSFDLSLYGIPLIVVAKSEEKK